MSGSVSTDPGARGDHSRRGDGRLMLWLGCSAFLFFLVFNHGHFTGSDEVAIYEMTQSIVARGDLAIPPIQHTAVGPDGRRYSFFSAGQSVLAIPLYQLGLLAERVLPYDWRSAIAGPANGYGPFVFGGEVPIGFVSLYAPLASAFLVLVFYRFSLALGTSRRNALLATALLASCTYVLMMSTYFLRHAAESAALLGSFYFFFRYKQGGPLRDLWIGCALAFELSSRLGLCPQEDPSRLRAHLKAMGMKADLADIPGELPGAEALYDLMGHKLTILIKLVQAMDGY